LEEAYPERSFLGQELNERAEIRRLISLWDVSFYQDVTYPILFEKHLKRYMKKDGPSGPDSSVIRQTKTSLNFYMHYVSTLLEQRNWLASHHFSSADITLAAHLSVIDYFGDILWDSNPVIKEWYVRIKSRPAFRSFFSDRIPGVLPAPNYGELDF
jgi:glutathione S-transferase